MTDQGKLTRSVIALSAAVVAGCAVTVTVKVAGADSEAARPPRLLDQEAVERQASAAARGSKNMSRDGVACPAAMDAKEGNTFDCTVLVGSNPKTVTVRVRDDQGQLGMTTATP